MRSLTTNGPLASQLQLSWLSNKIQYVHASQMKHWMPRYSIGECFSVQDWAASFVGVLAAESLVSIVIDRWSRLPNLSDHGHMVIGHTIHYTSQEKKDAGDHGISVGTLLCLYFCVRMAPT